MEKRIRLKGDVELPGGAKGEPWLCLTASGAWVLVPSASLLRGPAPATAVSARPGRRALTLTFDDLELVVPNKLADGVLELLGVARVRTERGTAFNPLASGPCIARPGGVEQALLAAWLGPEEPLLCLLPSESFEPMTSWALRDARGRLTLAVTPDRVALFIISPVGDVTERHVDPGSLRSHDGGARTTLGSRSLDTERHTALAQRLADVVALGPTERMLEVARYGWLESRAKGNLSPTRTLLALAARRGDPRADVASLMLGIELGEPTASLPEIDLGAVAALAHGGRDLHDLWRRWELSAPAGAAVLSRGRRLDVTLDLHAALTEARAPALGAADAALADVELGEHALAVGARGLARRVLESRLGQLGVHPLEQLEPHSAAAGARVATRIRILELLARARSRDEAPDPDTLRELAAAEPLSVARLEAAEQRCPAPARDRAAEARRLLEQAPLPPAPIAAPRAERPWSEAELATLRGEPPSEIGTLLGSVQRIVAMPDVPQRSHLVDYCEAISQGDASPVGGALRSATTLLGIERVDAFLSRGRLSVGVRAFDTAPPIVLVGGRHVDRADPLHMSASALTFAVTAELAHVRFDHGRVTPEQVWEGALARSHQGLELVLTVVPALRAVSTVRGVGKVAAQLDRGSVKKAVSRAERLSETIRSALTTARAESSDSDGLGTSNERLIEAHRYLQLGADRAGLAASGSLSGAVHALLASRTRYASVLEVLRDSSLIDVLRDRTQKDPAFADLALRLAGLIAFYLSNDFDRLVVDGPGRS